MRVTPWLCYLLKVHGFFCSEVFPQGPSLRLWGPIRHSWINAIWLENMCQFLPSNIFLEVGYIQDKSVQFSSVVQLCPTPCNPMDCSTPGLPVHHQLLELAQTHVHCISDAIQLSHPLSSPSPLTFNPSQHQGLFQWLSSSHQVAKILSFNFSISPSNEYWGLISFRMDWLDLLAKINKYIYIYMK